MIKKLRLKCHNFTSSNLGYTLPVNGGNKEINGPLSAGPSTRNHSVVEPALNGVIETTSQMVGYYDPLAGRTKLAEGGITLRIQNTARMQGTPRLCYSDDDTDLNDVPPDLSRAMKSISLNEESSTFCCTTQHVDSFSAEEEEETHMSWIEIMAKKRELERSLKSRGPMEARDIDEVLNPGATRDIRRQLKKSSFFSPSFKFRDLFPSANNTVKQKKPRKAKARSNRLGLCTTLRGQSSSMRRSSGSSNDPSPVLFDLRSRDLPAIPVQDLDGLLTDDNIDIGRTRNCWDGESRNSRAISSSGDVFIDSFNELKNKGWYWGPLSWKEAEDQLRDKPTGSFLVRDSSDDRYILSLTFKSEDKIHHTRIEHYRGQFSFNNQPKSLGAATIVEFIEKAIENCADGSFSYFLRPRGPGVPPTMFRLVRPVSRFTRIHSLQHLCRFVILSKIRRDMIDQLPVPSLVKKYLACAQYYIE